MKTKEFIRIRLDAGPDRVRTWLESAANMAEHIGERTFCVASLEIELPAPPASNTGSEEESETQPAAHRQGRMPHQRRYGIYNGDGVLVLRADLHCPDARTTLLELRRDEAFPLLAEEMMQQLQDRFLGARGDLLAEKPRLHAGAPPLACNVWLEEQLAQLPDPTQYHHLYTTWLAHYVTLRGYEPLDPRRSFRAAARSCLKRLRARNGA